MQELERYDTAELQAEIERRKRKESKPQPLKYIDESKIEDIRRMCINYVDALAQNSCSPKDLEEYVFEAAIEAVFGVEVWKWVNKQLG